MSGRRSVALIPSGLLRRRPTAGDVRARRGAPGHRVRDV